MTKIEWSDQSWNVTTGCTRVSEGCDNCYAVAMTRRLAAIESTKNKYAGLVNEGKDHFNGKIKLHPEVLEDPLHWRKPRRVFVNSMSDLFHPEVPFEFIDKVFAVMALCPEHTFQVLTKRPERMAVYLNQPEVRYDIGRQVESIKDINVEYHAAPDNFQWMAGYSKATHNHLRVKNWPIPNVWIGTSVENQEVADERIPRLLQCPAAVRFLSCEPLLGPLDLWEWIAEDPTKPEINKSLPNNYRPLHWVIVGGESGPGARPMHPDWVRSLRDQCKESDVPFFFKQWGAWRIANSDKDSWKDVSIVPNDGSWTESTGQYMKSHSFIGSEMNMLPMINVGKKKAGRELDGKEWNQFPDATAVNSN